VQERQPRQIPGDFRDIAVGSYFSLALRNDNTLVAWGTNEAGQLGIGTTASASTPQAVGSSYSRILGAGQAGSESSAAERSNGSTYVWGGNRYGALGIGSFENSTRPVRLEKEFHTLRIGWGTVGLARDGTLWMWGLVSFGGTLEVGENSNRPLYVMSATSR
jgi:alpha-tubulin suppressor-like RCC1 family protein